MIYLVFRLQGNVSLLSSHTTSKFCHTIILSFIEAIYSGVQYRDDNSAFSLDTYMTMSTPKKQPFKVCPMCNMCWPTRETFLDDNSLIYNGYQSNFGVLDEGLFYFTHETQTCGSTMIIEASAFISLYQGQRYSDSMQFTKECPGYCLEKNQLQRCQVLCRNAYVREVSHIILHRLHRMGYPNKAPELS
jgi:hypothetical protein